MRTLTHTRRWTAGLVLAAIMMSALSPTAEAAHRRYKGAGYYSPPPACPSPYAPRHVVYVERHSDAGPLLAGPIGGLVIGSVLAQNSAPAPAVAPAYYYWDPYCHERFASLGLYHSHFYHHYHPRVVRVISVETGACVNSYQWYEGDWHSDHHGDWDDD